MAAITEEQVAIDCFVEAKPKIDIEVVEKRADKISGHHRSASDVEHIYQMMNGSVHFLPSPNWYCSKIFDCNGDRLLAFGSRSSIVLLEIDALAVRSYSLNATKASTNDATTVTPEPSSFTVRAPISVRILNRLHSERVNGLCFNHGNRIITTSNPTPNHSHLLATVGDDLVVNVLDVDVSKWYHVKNDILDIENYDWNEDAQRGYQLIAQHKEHKARIVAVTWTVSPNEMSDCVLSGDEKGNLISFNVTSKKIVVYKPNTVGSNKLRYSEMTCLAACPSRPSIVAVGYQGGLIIILDLRLNGEPICELKHHDNDIQSISWAPFDGLGPLVATFDRASSSELDDLEDNLFVSASKDKTFRIWSIKQGAPLRTFNLPTSAKGVFGRRRLGTTASGEESKIFPWLTVNWPSFRPCTILAGSHLGQLMTFDLRNQERENNWSLVGQKQGQSHTRTIFNIATCMGLACTMSMDREIMFWELNQLKCDHWILTLPTINGFIYTLTFSPVNAGLMAIGCGDSVIRVWNTTSTSNPYEVQNFWQGIKSKVTALSWHPQKEGILAFGTMEGRVAICNVLTNKPPLLSKNFHRKVVYTLAWGPLCPTSATTNQDKQLHLYSCGDGIILVHDSSNLDKSALNLDKIISGDEPNRIKRPGRTDITFKPDFSILLLGNDDGTVELLDASTLTQRVIICAPRKLIQCIRWHPEYTINSSTKSVCQLWLAVASRDHTIHVHDLKRYLSNDMAGEAQSELSIRKKSSTSFELHGHRSAVATVAWSPHTDGRLVSASFDSTVRVWNVATMEQLLCFCGHANRVLCAEFNPLDMDSVASGGEDFTVRLWRMSEQVRFEHLKRRSVDAVKVKTAKHSGRQKSFDVKAEGNKENGVKELDAKNVEAETSYEITGDVVGELELLLERRRQEIMASQDKHLNTNSPIDSDNTSNHEVETSFKLKKKPIEDLKLQISPKVDNKFGAPKKKKRTFKSMFPVSNTRDNQGKAILLSDCIAMVDRISSVSQSNDGSGATNDSLTLGAYGSRIDAYKLIKVEGEHHRGNDNSEYAMHLDLWKGDVAGVIRNAAANDQLNDWLISMAPIVSHCFWKEMCLLYSKQLVSSGQPHKAVTFLLANQKIPEAIDVLKTHVSYKEAIVLAKIRLPSDDHLIQDLMEEWAAHMEREGQYEQAAKCHLSLDRVEKAATVLAQKQDADSLRVAAYISRRGLSNSEDAGAMADAYALRAAYGFLLNENYTMIDTVIAENNQLTPFRFVMESHKHIQQSLSEWSTQENSTNDPDTDASDRFSVLKIIYHKWLLDCKSIIDDAESLTRAVVLLSQESLPANPSKMLREIAVFLAAKASQVLICAMNSQFVDALQLVVKITGVLYRLCPSQLFWFFRCFLPRPSRPEAFFHFVNRNDECDSDSDTDEFDDLIRSLGTYRNLAILQEVSRTHFEPPLELQSAEQRITDEDVMEELASIDKSGTDFDVEDYQPLLDSVLLIDHTEVSVLKPSINSLRMSIWNALEKYACFEVCLNEEEQNVFDTITDKLSNLVSGISNLDIDEVLWIRNRIQTISRRAKVWIKGPLLGLHRPTVVMLAFLAEHNCVV